MSELIQNNDNRVTIRWKLLTGVSALALTAYVSSAHPAKAEDTDRPTIWIELGGQMDVMQGLGERFTAPFMGAITPTPGPYSDDIFAKGQKPPRFAFGEEGKITFQPESSDWIFSASIRYGRSHASRHIHQQSPPATATAYANHGTPIPHYALKAAAFADVKMPAQEKHTILDFSAGKDVGIGAFGRDGKSNIDLGVRFAQLTDNSAVNVVARPHIYAVLKKQFGNAKVPVPSFNNYTMTAHADHSFKGVGPSLSWNASAGIAGNMEDGELELDWGINAAVLFGRQKARTDHATSAYHFLGTKSKGKGYHLLYPHLPSHSHYSTRSRRVTVPNLGGSVGVSFKYPNFKFSIGYRYDTFLNAMDTGIDARKTSNLTFNGPYASISIGLGD